VQAEEPVVFHVTRGYIQLQSYIFAVKRRLQGNGQKLGRVDKPHKGDSADAARCASKLVFRWEISGDPWFAE
jgi:hypothetical protein